MTEDMIMFLEAEIDNCYEAHTEATLDEANNSLMQMPDHVLEEICEAEIDRDEFEDEFHQLLQYYGPHADIEEVMELEKNKV